MKSNNYVCWSKKNVAILILLLAGCINGNDYRSSEKLIDYYYLYKYSEHSYCVKCKLGCTTDKTIEGDIRKIWLNSRTMLIEIADTKERLRYFLIISSRESLECCNNNFQYEALRISEVDSIFNQKKIRRDDLDIVFTNLAIKE